MRIALGCDHRGFELKQVIMGLLQELGHSYHDFGCYGTDSVDYPDLAQKVGEAVASPDFDHGILICSTGIGMSIAANKIKGVRAALCHDTFTAQRARQHNDANILCLGGSKLEMAGVQLLQFSILRLSRSGPSESVLPSNEYRNAKH
jgi:ribose 5-phosphate isomerase B